MKRSVFAQTHEEARKLAAEKYGHSHFHISCVFFVKGDPTIREWVFTTVLG